jgi:octaprenyl-diphosphate synthase
MFNVFNLNAECGMNKLFDLVADELNQVEVELFQGLNSGILLIDEVGTHILKSGGKRFRPLIALLVSRFFNYQGKDHINLACALEYLHTATLLHDDVVDNGRIRRGNPSANSVWGDKVSVLAGDFLFSHSFSLLVKIGILKILKVFSKTTSQMAKGETLELNHLGDLNLSERDYFSIITDKTASLFSAACESSAILGKAQKEVQHSLKIYGLNLGIAFQLIDDLLDYIGSSEEFGKSIGKDLKEKKITLPLIHTLWQLTEEKKKDVKAILENEVLNEDSVSRIIQLITEEGGIDYTLKQAKIYSQQAKENLSPLPSSPEKIALLEAADYVVERKS